MKMYSLHYENPLIYEEETENKVNLKPDIETTTISLILDYINIYVYDSELKSPIVGAIIKNIVSGTLISSGTTDTQGKSKILISTSAINHLIISARDYETSETDETFFTKRDLYVYLTLLIEPPPISQYYADFYLVDNSKRRVKDAKIITITEENISNIDGLSRILLSEGYNNITFNEYYALVKSGLTWVRIHFPDFTESIDISRDTTYTVWVEQGIIQEGMPPPPLSNPWDILTKYWWVFLGSFVSLYTLSLFKPSVIVKVGKE